MVKISDKQELQQIAFNHLLDIIFKVFIKLNKKCTAKPYSFSVNKTTLLSDNLLRITRYPLEIMLKKELWQLMKKWKWKTTIRY